MEATLASPLVAKGGRPRKGAPGQGSLLAELEPEQKSLFSRRKRVTDSAEFTAATLGLNKWAEQDALPTLKGAAGTLAEAANDIQVWFAPASRGPSAERAGLIMRRRMAEVARKYDQAEFALRKARKYFESRPAKENYAFIHRMEKGEEQPTPEGQQIADVLRAMLDGRRRDVQAVAPGKLQSFYENYFPHIWKKERDAKQVFAAFFGRRPLEGGKSFLKKRTMPMFQDGLDAGLEPVSDNPIDLVMLKNREIDRFVMAHQVLQDFKAKKIARFVDSRKGKAPQGWRRIDDPIGVVYAPSTLMVAEFPNAGLYDALESTAAALGIKHKRGFTPLAGGRAIGQATVDGKEVRTYHGTKEDTLAHEIGHALDFQFGLGRWLMHDYPDAATASQIRNARKIIMDKGASKDAKRDARLTLKQYRPEIEQRRLVRTELRTLADIRMKDNGGERAKSYFHMREEKMAQLAQMWATMPDVFEEKAPTVFGIWKKWLDHDPRLKALKEIKPNLAARPLVQPLDAGGLVIRGYWYAPDGAAQILNNYLMPGLRSKSGLFRVALGINNTLNQAQLGLSFFHLATTGIDAATSRLALGIHQAAHGQFKAAAKSIATTPVAPFTNVIQGDKLLEEWFRPGGGGGHMGAIVDAMQTAGGRARMDEHYANHVVDNMKRALKAGNVLGAAFRLPFAILETATKPIMEYIVPRQKLGIFADLARMEMEREMDRLGVQASFKLNEAGQLEQSALITTELARKLAKAWDVVDDRMGQVVYDNYFWNRYAKDMAMLVTRSVGWNLGTLRVIAGGAMDFGRQAVNVGTGGKTGKPELTYRMGYLIAFPMMTALIAGIIHYAFTGETPAEFLDWFFPRNGEVDENGKAQRIALPTYMKDVFHYAEQPLTTLANKAGPLVNLTVEMLNNQDFYGTEIRHVDDPFVKQLLQTTQHIGEQMIPFGIREQQKTAGLGEPVSKQVLPFVGLTPAPKSITRTAAESKAFGYLADRRPEGARTKEEFDRSDLLRKMTRSIRLGKGVPAEATQALKSAQISPQQFRRAAGNSRFDSLQRTVRALSMEEALEVFAVATPAEKKKLMLLLASKVASVKEKSPSDQARILAKFRAAMADFRAQGR
jgi:hypothetical protein